MKTKITFFLTLLLSGLTGGLVAQNSPIYSLVRPIGGGNLNLVEINLTAGTETIIKAYLPSELNDYNPEVTTFDHQNNRLITIAYDQLGAESIISLDITNGNILFTYTSASLEPFSLEYGNEKIYSLARPLIGGDLKLVEFDLALGTETVIKTFLAAELYDYNPAFTSFDHQGSRFITIGSDQLFNDSLIAVNTSDGNINFSYASPSLEIFSPEHGTAKVYSLARSWIGGDLQLIEIDLILETATIIKSYLPSELDDYNPEATTFDHQNNRLVTIGYDLLGNGSLISINLINGNIDYSYVSLSNELFTVESGGALVTGSVKRSVENNSFFLYPNPAHNKIQLINSNRFTHVEIIDALGKKVVNKFILSSTLDISHLAPGIYLVKLFNDNISSFQRMIKQ